MYAVIANGGKQYRVQNGDMVKLEKIDSPVGTSIEFTKVLFLSDGSNLKFGMPDSDFKVTALIISHGRSKKIRIVKFKRRKHYMKSAGHRQYFTKVKITGIQGI